MTVHDWTRVIDVTMAAFPWALLVIVAGGVWDLGRVR